MHQTVGQDITDTPLSQFRVVEHKMGFKPLIGCSCGAVLDRNKRKANAMAFYREHAACVPREVIQEQVGKSGELA